MYVCMHIVAYLGTVCDEYVRVLLQSVIAQLHLPQYKDFDMYVCIYVCMTIKIIPLA